MTALSKKVFSFLSDCVILLPAQFLRRNCGKTAIERGIMIKNILFDMGNVLIHWEPERLVRRLGFEGADAALLLREIYHSVDWVMLDRGTLDDAGAIARIRARLPEHLRDSVETLISHWDEGWGEESLQVAGMEALAEELAGNGYGLCLLTNASKRHRAYWPKFPVSRLFGDRIMRSADWGLLKPEAAFYEKAFSLLDLRPEECLFVDDNPCNIEAAGRLGLEGLVFYGDAADLRRRLRERGVSLVEKEGERL